MKKKYGLFFVTTALVVILDQIIKAYIVSIMHIGESMAVIKGLFSITYVRNPGAAFGFLANASPMFRSIFFIVITLTAIFLILSYIRKSKVEEQFVTFSLSLILAGAIGNLIDRVRFGEVIDFLDFYLGSYHWPTFNAADSAISLGAIILIVEMVRKRKDSQNLI